MLSERTWVACEPFKMKRSGANGRLIGRNVPELTQTAFRCYLPNMVGDGALFPLGYIEDGIGGQNGEFTFVSRRD